MGDTELTLSQRGHRIDTHYKGDTELTLRGHRSDTENSEQQFVGRSSAQTRTMDWKLRFIRCYLRVAASDLPITG